MRDPKNQMWAEACALRTHPNDGRVDRYLHLSNQIIV